MADITNNLPQLKTVLNADSVKNKFVDMLGKKAAGFMTSITTCVQNNDLLQKADVNSIILAAGQAASLDLPINQNLGFASIIPFYDSKLGKNLAQFQIQRDGWVELCLRSGQFEYIVNEPVYEGELVERNRFTDTYIFDESKRTSDKIMGYTAAFPLRTGSKKTVYSTVDECKAHGMKYSQTFKKGFGLWKTAFDSMALKTVLKHLLKKYAPKSIESITKAIESDQATFEGELGDARAVYSDNPNGQQVEYAEVVEVNEDTGEVVDAKTEQF